MTLRDLADMAIARQRAEWQRLGTATAWIINRNGWTSTPVQPDEIIPPQYRPEVKVRKKTEEELIEESRLAWKQMDYFFGRHGGANNGPGKR